MSDLSSTEVGNGNKHKKRMTVDRDLDKLKELLLKQEQEKIEFLLNHLKDSRLHARDMAKDLPKAIIYSANHDTELNASLTPVIETVIRSSFKKNIKLFADAIYPIIGPAIRKAISESLKSLIQSVNTTLEHSFSLTGLKWRIESIKTGKSFAEIVLANTLLYQVEQIFLIHKKSGVLLHHLMNKSSVVQDVDLISGMFNAIQHFVKDSFSITDDETLNLLEVGDLTVWVEQSPDIILAGVIRGIAPKELRLIFQNALEEIQLLKGEYLEQFNGDTAPFKDTEEQLGNCLQYKLKERKKNKKSKRMFPRIALFSMIIIIGLFLFSYVKEKNSFEKYIKKLQNSPGILVTSIERNNGKYCISGLRDPLSIDPFKLINTNEIDTANVCFNFKPFISTQPKIMMARLIEITKPPIGVIFEIEKGVIVCKGSAHHSWISAAKNKMAGLLFHVKYDDSKLIDIENDKFIKIIRNIERQHISFKKNVIRYSKNEENKLRLVAIDIKHVVQLADSLNKKIKIKVFAHSDHIGTAKVNSRYTILRINNIVQELEKFGIKDDIIMKSYLEEEKKIVNKKSGKRCVHFEVVI